MTTPEPPAPARRTGLIIGASVVAVLVIAALTTASVIALTHHSKPTSAAAATVTTPAPAVTTAATASVSQYASAVSPPVKSLRETSARYEDGGCPLQTTPSLACKITVMTLGIASKTLVLTVQSAHNPSTPVYIGDPPAEIRTLVADTEAAAQDLDDAASADTEGNPAPIFSALNRLKTVLDRWDPYM